MINNELKLKPCPLCGGRPEIIYAREYSDKNVIQIQCLNCGLSLEHTQEYIFQDRFDNKLQTYIPERVGFYNESAIDLWNKRTPDLGNDGEQLLDEMFPKCTNCKSRPSDYSSVVCMCNEGIYIPQHPPRGQDTRFRLGKYEEMEINK